MRRAPASGPIVARLRWGAAPESPSGVIMEPNVSPPAWTKDADGWTSYFRGLAVAADVPGWILFATALGFGALAQELGFTIWHTLFISGFVYALPAQVVLIDQLARGAALAAVAFVVSVTAIRLLPATVTLVPLFKDPTRPRWMAIAAVHFCAVTAWLEGLRRLPDIPVHLRMPHFLGIGFGMLLQTFFGSLVGYMLAAALPPTISAALLFMTPIYFLLSLVANARAIEDKLAVPLGFGLGPLFYLVVPGFDLLAAGLLAGTLAFFWPKVRR